MKKIVFRIVLPILLILNIIISGCTSNVKTNNNVQVDTYQMKRLPTETLTFYFPGYEPEDEKEKLKRLENEVAQTLNVHLDFKWFPKDGYICDFRTFYYQNGWYIDEMNRLIRDNIPLDAFVLSKDDYSDDFLSMIERGNILDLAPLLDKEAPRLKEVYTKEELANVTYGGKLAAIPQHYPKSNRICAVIDKKALEEIANPGLQIKRYEDFENFLSLCKRKSSKIPTLIDLNSIDLFAESYGYVHIGNHLVYKWDDPSMKLMPWEQTPEFKTSLKTIERWNENGYIGNYGTFAVGAIDQPVSSLEFMAARDAHGIASLLTTWDSAQAFIHNYALSDQEYVVYPLYPDKPTKTPIDTVGIAISKNCRHRERVLKFLEYLQTHGEYYDLFMYGENDKNYVLKDDKVDFPPNKVKYYGWDGSIAFWNINFTKGTMKDTEPFAETYQSQTTHNQKYSPSFGFVPDTNGIKELINARNKAYKEMDKQIKTKRTDIDNFIDNFINIQRENRVEEVVSTIQEQIDKWKEATNK